MSERIVWQRREPTMDATMAVRLLSAGLIRREAPAWHPIQPAKPQPKLAELISKKAQEVIPHSWKQHKYCQRMAEQNGFPDANAFNRWRVAQWRRKRKLAMKGKKP